MYRQNLRHATETMRPLSFDYGSTPLNTEKIVCYFTWMFYDKDAIHITYHCL